MPKSFVAAEGPGQSVQDSNGGVFEAGCSTQQRTWANGDGVGQCVRKGDTRADRPQIMGLNMERIELSPCFLGVFGDCTPQLVSVITCLTWLRKHIEALSTVACIFLGVVSGTRAL